MIEKIESVICAGEGYLPSEIHVKCRKRGIKETRQIIMYFAMKNTNMTEAAVGNYFEGKDHSTVSHAIKTINNHIDCESAFRRKINYYKKIFKGDISDIKRIKANRTVDAILDEINRIEVRINELNKIFAELKTELKTLNK